ncbi:MAG: sugar phosphate nucleotidyltransferase [Bacteroidota bacterium]
MENPTYVVIMAGGIGSRFWPGSRTSYPKQFNDILGVGRTMLQETVRRVSSVCPTENFFVVTNAEYVSLVQEQISDVPADNILGFSIDRKYEKNRIIIIETP